MIGAVIGIIIWGVIWGAATQTVVYNKGYEENWFWWGFFFGFIALLVALSKPQLYSTGPLSPQLAREAEERRTMEAGGWKCVCGRLNPSYTGTCACGRSRQAVLAAAAEPALENEGATVRMIKQYKELLDSGAITQEEFEKKKREILG
ncbi:SHOCT domain-containing protein [Neglectibacter caecimuris]|uniref:SHOCT domain-containing protein n=1 Tax=Neglectibacter caecimuris TaxID=3093658 RepID=UPI002AC8A4F3|nr:SHOCT domain-containing protein [Neglectibacter sp. M00184]